MTGLEPAASAVTGQQRDVTDGYQTVSADVVWYEMVLEDISYRPLNVPQILSVVRRTRLRITNLNCAVHERAQPFQRLPIRCLQ
jgi:hypothetical protein